MKYAGSHVMVADYTSPPLDEITKIQETSLIVPALVIDGQSVRLVPDAIVLSNIKSETFISNDVILIEDPVKSYIRDFVAFFDTHFEDGRVLSWFFNGDICEINEHVCIKIEHPDLKVSGVSFTPHIRHDLKETLTGNVYLPLRSNIFHSSNERVISAVGTDMFGILIPVK